MVGKVDGGQFAAPKRTGVEGKDVVGVHKAQRRPVSEDDGVAEVLPVGGFEPRAQVRGHFFEGGFVVVVEFVFQRQRTHSGKDVDNHAQAVVAGQVFAPFGGFVAVHFGEKLFVFFAAQLGFGFAGEQFGAGDGPLGQDAGVNHNMAHAFDQQGLEAQPIEHFFAVGVLEDGGDGVAALDGTFAVADGEQVQVMVAKNHADAAFVFHAELEDFEGFGAAVDDVAGQPECVGAVVETDFVEQGGQFVEAALNIADCVVCHIRILALDGLLCFRRPFKGNRNMRPSENGLWVVRIMRSTPARLQLRPARLWAGRRHRRRRGRGRVLG